MENQVTAFRGKLAEAIAVEEGTTELRKMGQFVHGAIQKMTAHDKHEFLTSVFGLRKIKVFKENSAKGFKLEGQGIFDLKKASELLRPYINDSVSPFSQLKPKKLL